MARVGLGIIGCGNIGPVHADAISQVKGVKLVGVADVVEANAQALAERYATTAYTDYERLLERPDLHAVTLCVPSGLRTEIAKKCAEAGKHILVEKPLEVTTKRIDRLVGYADKAGVKLGCVFQSRFADGTLKLRKAIDQGRFGKLVLAGAYIKWYRSQAYYDSSAWRGTRQFDGGGALMNQGIHQIDLLLWFMGPVKWVRAQTRTVGHTGLEVEDLGCAMLEFKNGAMGMIEGSTAIWHGHPGRVEVHGTEGTAILEDNEPVAWEFKKGNRADARIRASFGSEKALGSGAGDPLADLKSEGHRRNIQDFVKSIRDNRPPAIEGREGRQAVELIEAIYKSASSGRRVSL